MNALWGAVDRVESVLPPFMRREPKSITRQLLDFGVEVGDFAKTLVAKGWAGAWRFFRYANIEELIFYWSTLIILAFPVALATLYWYHRKLTRRPLSNLQRLPRTNGHSKAQSLPLSRNEKVIKYSSSPAKQPQSVATVMKSPSTLSTLSDRTRSPTRNPRMSGVANDVVVVQADESVTASPVKAAPIVIPPGKRTPSPRKRLPILPAAGDLPGRFFDDNGSLSQRQHDANLNSNNMTSWMAANSSKSNSTATISNTFTSFFGGWFGGSAKNTTPKVRPVKLTWPTPTPEKAESTYQSRKNKSGNKTPVNPVEILAERDRRRSSQHRRRSSARRMQETNDDSSVSPTRRSASAKRTRRRKQDVPSELTDQTTKAPTAVTMPTDNVEPAQDPSAGDKIALASQDQPLGKQEDASAKVEPASISITETQRDPNAPPPPLPLTGPVTYNNMSDFTVAVHEAYARGLIRPAQTSQARRWRSSRGRVNYPTIGTISTSAAAAAAMSHNDNTRVSKTKSATSTPMRDRSLSHTSTVKKPPTGNPKIAMPAPVAEAQKMRDTQLVSAGPKPLAIELKDSVCYKAGNNGDDTENKLHQNVHDWDIAKVDSDQVEPDQVDCAAGDGAGAGEKPNAKEIVFTPPPLQTLLASKLPKPANYEHHQVYHMQMMNGNEDAGQDNDGDGELKKQSSEMELHPIENCVLRVSESVTTNGSMHSNNSAGNRIDVRGNKTMALRVRQRMREQEKKDNEERQQELHRRRTRAYLSNRAKASSSCGTTHLPPAPAEDSEM